jgi:hypothetical protein
VMLKRIWNAVCFWRRWRRPPKHTLVEQEAARPAEPQRPLSLILWGAGREDGSGIMCEWLKDINSPPDVTRHVVVGKSVTRDDILGTLRDTEHARRVKVFCGHGYDDFLLGATYPGCDTFTLDGEDYSVLYDASMVSDCPSAMFAFCCKAAKKLAADFVSPGGRTFLGYVENIGYDLFNEECQRTWKDIITKVAEEVVKDGEIKKKHHDLLVRMYDDAIDHYMSGPGRDNDRALDMAMYLIRHQKYLRRL